MTTSTGPSRGDGVEGFGIDPFTCSPGELLRSVADLAPGSLLMGTLLMVDPSALAPEDALLYLTLHDRVTAWWATYQTEALVAAADAEPRIDEYLVLDPRPDHDEERRIHIEDAAREEVAASLRLHPSTAQHRIDHARLLAGPLQATRQALELGEITPAHAVAIAAAAERLSTRLDPEPFRADCLALQGRVLPIARRGTVGRTRSAAARWVERIDADGQRRRRAMARCTRDVYVSAGEDGNATLIARMDALAAQAVMRAIDDSVADAGIPGSPDATVGERRTEVLAHLLLSAARGESGARPGIALDVTVSLADLVTDRPGAAVLPDGTHIGLEQLGEALQDPEVRCTVRRLLTDPVTGHLLDVGRTRYELPAALRRHIVARDRTCRFPGCGRRASLCQIDHAEAWEDGGGTDVGNLGALCTRHHQLKTHGGWSIEDAGADGSCTWVSPSGSRYRRDPEPLPTAHILDHPPPRLSDAACHPPAVPPF